MKIHLENAGKKFNRKWIFRNLNLEIEEGKCFAILGPNGSGKSTLVKCIAGITSLSEGKTMHVQDGKTVESSRLFSSVMYSSPAMELIEEFTLHEFLTFHFGMREMFHANEISEVAALANLETSIHKTISEFSSGMKQRLKLALCFFSRSDLLLLDEPCTNLDSRGIAMYHDWMQKFRNKRTTIIASNMEAEYGMCEDSFTL